MTVMQQKTSSSQSGTGTISYYFENATSATSGSNITYEFDIYVSASDPVWFDNGLVRIKYNTNAFGANVVANNKITVQRGTVIADISQYQLPPAPSDITSDVIAIPFSVDPTNFTGRYLIDQIPEQLCHVKIEAQQCLTPNLEFVDQTTMLLLSLYSNSSTSTQLYSFANIDASDTENSPICTAEISNISPAVVAAGVGDIVTISGNGFGNSPGYIRMRDSDDGGASWINRLDDYDIVSWSDNLIEIRVPSRIEEPRDVITPGSGPIRVVTSDGAVVTSSQSLIVDYAWKNRVFQNPDLKDKIFLAGIDMVTDVGGSAQSLGYSFLIDPQITSNSQQLTCIEEALREWSCVSEVRWDYKTSYPAFPINTNDRVSTIRFGTINGVGIKSGTTVWFTSCTGPGGNPITFVEDIDIVINDNPAIQWFYDPSGTQDLPAGNTDFYSVVLHELGHGHLHKHVNQPGDLMYFERAGSAYSSTPHWQRNLTFAGAVLGSSINMMSESVSFNLSSCSGQQSISPMIIPDCSFNTNIDHVKSDMISDFNLYPNPFKDVLTLSLKDNTTSTVMVRVSSLTGVVVYEQRINSNTEAIIINLDDAINPGIFIAEIFLGGEKYSAKILKIE